MMLRNRLHYALAAALLASVAVVGCKKKEEPVAVTPAPAPAEPAPMPAEPAPAPAAVSVTSVTLGNSAGADKMIAAPMTTFSPKDKIIVSVATSGTASNAELAAKLLYQDGQTAGEQKQVLNTTDIGTTNIEFTNTKPWPAGKYKAEVWLNGAVAQTAEFEVKYKHLPLERSPLYYPIRPEALGDTAPVPLHAGAARYYREQGLLP